MSPDPGVSVKPKLFPTVCANDSLDGWISATLGAWMVEEFDIQ